MPLDKLDSWLQGRTGAAAASLSMLDGFVTAIVAGPVSIDPREWICSLLGIEPDALAPIIDRGFFFFAAFTDPDELETESMIFETVRFTARAGGCIS